MFARLRDAPKTTSQFGPGSMIQAILTYVLLASRLSRRGVLATGNARQEPGDGWFRQRQRDVLLI